RNREQTALVTRLTMDVLHNEKCPYLTIRAFSLTTVQTARFSHSLDWRGFVLKARFIRLLPPQRVGDVPMTMSQIRRVFIASQPSAIRYVEWCVLSRCLSPRQDDPWVVVVACFFQDV
ncbi:hypothetical protein ACQKEM_08465, partial [Pseudomonas sp. NPDC077382]